MIFIALQYIEPKEADADDEDANVLLEDDNDDIESPSDDDGTYTCILSYMYNYVVDEKFALLAAVLDEMDSSKIYICI